MTLIVPDRVQETTVTGGTGAVTLLGAVAGYQSFAAVGNGNTVYYTIADQSGSNWEVGIGTYSTTGPTLTRTTVLASSNSNSLVSFAANAKNVFATIPSKVIQGPAFSAYQTVTQSCAATTFTKMIYDTVTFDTASCYNATTGRFTPNFPGYYHINGTTSFASGTADTLINLGLYLNGTIYRSTYSTNATGGVGSLISDIVYLNGSTDYVELYGKQNTAGSLTTWATNNATWMSGTFIRGA